MFDLKRVGRLQQAAVVALFFAVVYYLRLSWDRYEARSASHPEQLHVLIPVNNVNALACRCILSANILGYATPVLVNWKRDSEYVRPKWRAHGTHIDKMVGVLRYLETLVGQNPASKVLVVDGFDTWFQLPPATLLNRYDSVNEKHSRYISDIVGKDTVAAEHLHQSIIFPAQKECGPKDSGDLSFDQPGCYAVPPSPLRADLFGPRTDIDDAPYPWRIRPRWLCSGLTLGPAWDLRAMYAAGSRLITAFNHGGSDQLIFSKMFGEQWYQRHVMKERLEHGLGALSSGRIPASLPTKSELGRYHAMPRYRDQPLEFSIGLDYGMEISHSQVFSEWDGRFLVYNDSESLAAQQQLFNIEDSMGYRLGAPRVQFPLAAEITSLPPPVPVFAKGAQQPPALPQLSWSTIPLYSNIFTGTIPVTVHLNGMKERIGELWPSMWYYPYLRDFLAAEQSRRPVGAYDDEGKFLAWDSLCGAFEKDVLPPVS